jgi:cytochrome c553
MNFFERIPTRWLLAGAGVACLALWAAPSSAQTSGDATTGKRLFDDTSNESGLPQLGTCTNCHTVQDRRSRIATGNLSGAPFADISFDQVLSHFSTAIGGNYGGSMGQFSQLDPQQRGDITAYIADTPKLSATGMTIAPNALAFSATAVGNAVTKNITINHSVATIDNLQITSVSLAAGASAFTRTSSCNGVTRTPAGTCTFSVTYTPTGTTNESKVLTVSLQQGSVAFTRTVTLNGSVAGVVVTPPSTGGASSDSGGGALGGLWLSGLALATAMLARRRRV